MFVFMRSQGYILRFQHPLTVVAFFIFQMASVIHQSQKRPTDAYGCNWLERLRQIKRVRTKAAAENFSLPSSPIGKISPLSHGLRMSSVPVSGLTDFTEYIMK